MPSNEPAAPVPASDRKPMPPVDRNATDPPQSPSPTSSEQGDTVAVDDIANTTPTDSAEPAAPKDSAEPTTPTDSTEPTTPTNKVDLKAKLYSTPQHRNLQTSAPHVSDLNGWKAQEIQIKLFGESIRSFVGYMDPEMFMNQFLPWRRKPRAIAANVTLPAFGMKKVKESRVYDPFVGQANKLRLKNIHFVNSSTSPDKKAIIPGIKPDMAVYRKRSGIKGTDFSQMEMWLEAKNAIDPFNDPAELEEIVENETENDRLDPLRIIGQLTSYAVAHLGGGFRTHCFSVFLVGRTARFLRWDRAGAIVSEAFDYIEKTHLVEFFKRFDQLTPKQRGWDLTIRTPKAVHRRAAKAMLVPKRRTEESDKKFRERKKDVNPKKFVEYRVPDSEGGKPLCFVGPPPTRIPLSLQGRSSRGCAVYDVKNKRVCYLKDTWRVDSDLLKQEGETYKELQEAGVQHIASVIAHGDVASVRDALKSKAELRSTGQSTVPDATQTVEASPVSNVDLGDGHRTMTDKFCQEPWCTLKLFKNPLRGFVHYRLVLNVVGRDLSSFRSTKEVVQVFIDALEAHRQAYLKARILHRDISIGNLMITEDGRGFLIDWDLAKSIDVIEPRTSGRTGTWQFISAGLLMYPGKEHVYADDLESFLHVLFYTLLRFSKSNYTPAQLRNLVEKVFNEIFVEDNQGGTAKAEQLCFTLGYVPLKLKFTGRERLADHLRWIAGMFKDLYIQPESEEDARDSEGDSKSDDVGDGKGDAEAEGEGTDLNGGKGKGRVDGERERDNQAIEDKGKDKDDDNDDNDDNDDGNVEGNGKEDAYDEDLDADDEDDNDEDEDDEDADEAGEDDEDEEDEDDEDDEDDDDYDDNDDNTDSDSNDGADDDEDDEDDEDDDELADDSVDNTVSYEINPDAVNRLEQSGFEQFKERLVGIRKLSEKWQRDCPGKPVPIANSKRRIYVQNILERMRWKTSYHTSEMLSGLHDTDTANDLPRWENIPTTQKRTHEEMNPNSELGQRSVRPFVRGDGEEQ